MVIGIYIHNINESLDFKVEVFSTIVAIRPAVVLEFIHILAHFDNNHLDDEINKKILEYQLGDYERKLH